MSQIINSLRDAVAKGDKALTRELVELLFDILVEIFRGLDSDDPKIKKIADDFKDVKASWDNEQ